MNPDKPKSDHRFHNHFLKGLLRQLKRDWRLFALLLFLSAGLVSAIFVSLSPQDLRRGAATNLAEFVFVPGSGNITPGSTQEILITVNTKNYQVDGIQLLANLSGSVPADLTLVPQTVSGLSQVVASLDQSGDPDLKLAFLTANPSTPFSTNNSSVTVAKLTFTAPTTGQFSINFDTTPVSKITETGTGTNILEPPTALSYTFQSGNTGQSGDCTPDSRGGTTITLYPPESEVGCSDLQAAIDAVTGSGYTILITPGTYTIDPLDQGWTIMATFKTDLTITAADPDNPPTLVFQDHRGGLRIEDSDQITLSHMTFTGATTNGIISAQDNGTLDFHHLTFSDTNANNMQISNINDFSLTHSSVTGGSRIAVRVGAVANFDISHNTFANIDTGVMINNSDGTLSYNLINNMSEAGIRFSNGQVVAHHNTINQIARPDTGVSSAIYIIAAENNILPSALTLHDNIITNSTRGIYSGNPLPSSFTLTLENNLFWNNTFDFINIPNTIGQAGNLSADPLYQNTADFCYPTNSPALYGDYSADEYIGHRGPCVAPTNPPNPTYNPAIWFTTPSIYVDPNSQSSFDLKFNTLGHQLTDIYAVFYIEGSLDFNTLTQAFHPDHTSRIHNSQGLELISSSTETISATKQKITTHFQSVGPYFSEGSGEVPIYRINFTTGSTGTINTYLDLNETYITYYNSTNTELDIVHSSVVPQKNIINPPSTDPPPAGGPSDPPAATNLQYLDIVGSFHGISRDVGPIPASVTLGLTGQATPTINTNLIFVHLADNRYQARLDLTGSGLTDASTYWLTVKGQKHMMRSFEELDLEPTTSLDLTFAPFLPGDLPPQDGTLDTNDRNYLLTAMSKTFPTITDLDTADVNYDGQVNSVDYGLLLYTINQLSN